MLILKTLLVTVVGLSALLCTASLAQQAQTEARPLPDGPTAEQRKKLYPRRAVAQVIQAMPPSTRPIEPNRAPFILAPAQPPPAPQILQGCTGAGCYAPGGERLNGGVGNTVLDAQGRPCIRATVTAQCF